MNDPKAKSSIAPDSKTSSTEEESQEIRDLSRDLEALARRSQNLSWFRLLSFAGIVIGVLAGISSPLYPLILGVPALASFVFALGAHGRVQRRQSALEVRRTLLREQRHRARSRKRDHPAPPLDLGSPLALDRGESLLEVETDVFAIDEGLANDLDLFDGPRSIFGFVDVSSTVLGSRRLRRMLSHLLTSSESIRERQGAVRALADRDDLRFRLLEALAPLRKYSYDSVPGFLHSDPEFPKISRVALVANLFGTVAPALVLLSIFVHPGFLTLLILTFMLNLFVIGLYLKRLTAARDRVLLFGSLLDALLALDGIFDGAGFDRLSLQKIQAALAEQRPVNRGIRRYIRLLEVHGYGMFFEVLNVLTLWELRFVPFAERLLHTHRHVLERGIGALAETEALLSLACPLAEHSTFTLPEPLREEKPFLEIEGVGHPLIEDGSVVRNDFQIGGETTVAIVTGSNMAGKSTFLKSVAVNVLLASAGGPVSAKSLRWTPVSLYSDLNVRDSLDDGKSYFQVEVERVRDVIRASETNPFLFAIFDELFRGTNSDERLALCRSILRYLRGTGMLLVVATHDNAVTSLVTEENELGMMNCHFEEQVSDGRMTFDYRLRSGPARTRNAIRVLEMTGYPEPIVKQARAEAGFEVGR